MSEQNVVTQIENPFSELRTPREHALWELMKDGRRYFDSFLREQLKQKGLSNSITPPLRNINNRGLQPYGDDYPTGRWVVIRERHRSELKFNDPVDKFDVDLVKKAVDERVGQQVAAVIKDRLEIATREHQELISKQIEEMRKSSVPILELQRYEGPEKVVKKIEPAHEMMQYLLYLLNQGEHVYLFGDAGSGKSTAAFMAAQALGRRYGYISLTPQTFESRLFGFMAADGKTYVRTEFRDCYEKGGVFCVDEMDNGSGNLYTALNGALENNICAFPDKSIKRHPDFVVIGTGNTSGGGPNPMFPTRRPFDKAFAERFTYLEWGYDERLERSVALAINEPVAPVWHEYCLTMRKYCQQHFPMVLVSPRAVFKGCKYMRDNVMGLDLILKAVVFKGYDRDSVNKILAACMPPVEKLAEAAAEYIHQHNGRAKKAVKNAVN